MRKPYQPPTPPEEDFQPLAVLRPHWKKIFFICAGVILLVWGVAVIGGAIVSRAGRWTTQQAKFTEQKVLLRTQVTFVRDELLLTEQAAGTVVPLAQAGERVGAGQSYAAVCANGQDAEALSRLRALEQRLDWLREAAEAQHYHALNAGQLGRQVDETFQELLKDLDRGELQRLPEWQEMFLHRSTTLEAALGRPVDLSKEIGSVETELTALRAKVNPGRFTQCIAPQSGCYYPIADGMEQLLTPEKLLENLGPAQFSRLWREAQGVDINEETGTRGKLVRGFTWYAAVQLTASEAQKLREGAQYAVQFPQESAREFHMTVQTIRREGEQALVVFSCNEKDDVLYCLRTAKAEISLDIVDGLAIPSAALRFLNVGEGAQSRKATGVYIVRAGKLHWRETEVLYQDRRTAVVAWGRQKEAQAIEGDAITVSGSIQSMTQPAAGKLLIIGKDMLITSEDLHVQPAIPGGPTRMVTARRRLFDETILTGKNLSMEQADGKVILTGEDITYREQRGAGLKIHDTVLVTGKTPQEVTE